MSKLEFYSSKLKILKTNFFLLFIFPVIISLIIIFLKDDFKNFVTSWVDFLFISFAMLGVFFYLISVIAITVRFFNKNPVLVLTKKSFYEKVGKFAHKTEIDWEDVQIITIFGLYTNKGDYKLIREKEKFLQIKIKNSEVVLDLDTDLLGLNLSRDELFKQFQTFYQNLNLDSVNSILFLDFYTQENSISLDEAHSLYDL